MNIKTIASSSTRYLQRLVRAILGTEPRPVEIMLSHRAEVPTNVTESAHKDVANPAKRKRRQLPAPKVDALPLEQRRWLTIKEASARFPCFSEKSLRHLIAQAEAYSKYPKEGLRSNGLIGCFCQPAGQRKILIDAAKFDAWLEGGALSASNATPAKARHAARVAA